MSYRLRKEESIPNGLRRVGRTQIEAALAAARGEIDADSPVHETRKHLKKARAALALVKKEIGRGQFQKHDHLMRDVGRLISEIRDAEVRLDTVRQVQEVTQSRSRRKFRKVEELLMLELENFISAFAEWQQQAVPMLERLRDDIDSWPVDNFGPRQLCRAVRATYKRGRRALAETRNSRHPESFHELRKEAKQLWYQLRILRPINPVVLATLTDELKSLGDLLGRGHDLSFLRERLRQEREPTPWQRESQELLALIETSENDLQRGAADLAERFYAERPKEFSARLSGWLESWQECSAISLADALVNDGNVPAAIKA